MARWKLLAKHYLNVPGTEWEYKEVDRTTGRPKRSVFPVPVHLDPDDPADWNYRNSQWEGEIIVSDGTDPQPKDIIFEGPPTPDMLPMDDAAKAISAGFQAQWKHPIESLSPTYGAALLDKLTSQVADVQASTKTAPMEGMTELLTAMAKMMEQNQQMMAALMTKSAPAVVRR